MNPKKILSALTATTCSIGFMATNVMVGMANAASSAEPTAIVGYEEQQSQTNYWVGDILSVCDEPIPVYDNPELIGEKCGFASVDMTVTRIMGGDIYEVNVLYFGTVYVKLDSNNVELYERQALNIKDTTAIGFLGSDDKKAGEIRNGPEYDSEIIGYLSRSVD